jgi:hypothetical protein
MQPIKIVLLLLQHYSVQLDIGIIHHKVFGHETSELR